jgi:hypothetical protein
MSSARRIAASRANGKKSQGPVTPEGKARSAANATKHGLASPESAAQAVCLTNENRTTYIELHEELIAEHAPATATERLIVEEMAMCRYRLNRAVFFESALIDNQMDEMEAELARTWELTDHATAAALGFRKLTEASPALPILHRYETRLSRQFDRCLRRLTALRTTQKSELPIEPSPKNEHPEPDPTLPSHQQPTPVAQSPLGLERKPFVAPPQPAPEMDGLHHQTRRHDSEPAPGPASPLPRAA